MTTDGKVIITKEAFRNMITHVLRFGNESLETSVEVMGVCMGKKASNGKNIQVVNAIPLTHGTQIENDFSPEDFESFAKIDEQYKKKDLTVVGWYHSHPNEGLFFSDFDKNNHLYYQKKQSPHGFGIVFDHSLMGKDDNFGFKIFRLADYREGTSSECEEVDYEIEVPNTLDFFNWTKKFVEDSQKKAPLLIKEIDEFVGPKPSELQSIPISPEDLTEQEDNVSEMAPIFSGFQHGAASFSEIFMGYFMTQLSKWTKDINEGTLNGNEYLRNTLLQMKDSIGFSMSKIEKSFEKNLDDNIDTFKKSVSAYVDERIEAQKELANHVINIKGEAINEVNNLIDNNINNITSQIEGGIKGITEKLADSSQVGSKLEEIIKNTTEKITTIINEANNLKTELISDIESSVHPIESDIAGKIEKVNSEFNPIKDSFAEIGNLLQKLQEVAKHFSEI
jgi:proteasome lid subunit RPN8/RPN11/archaellum component FlaC